LAKRIWVPVYLNENHKSYYMPQISPKQFTRRQRQAVGYAAILVALSILGWQAGLHRAALAQTIKLATTKQPERFTELYFVTPQTLPTAVSINKSYQLNYRVVSHQATPVTYTYQTWYILSGQKRLINQGIITLADGQSSDQVINFVARNDSQTYQVGVTIVELDQTISLRVAS